MRISPLTIGLGISTTVSYGVLYYSFAMLSPKMAQEMGWDLSLVFAIFSVSLLAGAAAAPLAGRLIHRHGARLVMSCGTVLASVALVLFAKAGTLAMAGGAILLAEVVAVTVQYEATFIALARRHGMAAAPHITGVTLIAGFASTIFWPLIDSLLAVTDWRNVYLLLALLNLAINLPIHLSIPATRVVPSESQPNTAARAPLMTAGSPDWRRAMVLIGIVFTSTGVVMAAINSSVMVLLHDIGFDSRTAAWSVALIGPSQVFARATEFYVSRHLPATGVTVISTVLMAVGLGFLVMASSHPAVGLVMAFAVLYGSGQGLSSIVKGVLPLTYFGDQDYARIMGKLSGIRLAFAAMSPVAVIWVQEQSGAEAALGLLAAIIAVGVVAVIMLARDDPSRRKAESGP